MNLFLYRDFDPQIFQSLAECHRDFILVEYDLAHPIKPGDAIALRSGHLMLGIVKFVMDSQHNPRLFQGDQEGSAIVQIVPPTQEQVEEIRILLDVLEVKKEKSRIIIPDINWN